MEEKIDKAGGTKVEISLLKAFNIRLEGFSPEQANVILGKIFSIKVCLVFIILFTVLMLIKGLNINDIWV